MKNKISYSYILLFVIIIAVQLYSQEFQRLIEEGDSLLEHNFNNEKALTLYLAAYKLEPDNWEVNWRLSRVTSLIAEQMPESIESHKESKLNKYKIALSYAQHAIEKNSEQSIAYLYSAIAKGRIAMLSGIFSVSSLMDEVRSDISKVLLFDNAPPFFMALSHFVLGRAHYELCEKSYLIRLPLGLGWANIKDAIDLFKKAIEIYPDYRLFHLYKAKAYIEAGQKDEAEEHLKKIPLIKEKHFQDDKFLAESKIMIEQLNKK